MSFMPKNIIMAVRERKASVAVIFLYIPKRRIRPRMISKIPWIVRKLSLWMSGSVSIHIGTNPIQAEGFASELMPA
mgnify:CR=1 FL=1